MTLLEIATETVAGVRAAHAGGARRVELCSSLEVGGLTPSAGTILGARRSTEIELMVLVRPRRGDFVYSSAELETVRADVRVAKELGADGVVLGCLHPDGTIDRERTGELVDAARPLSVTFHRAFDHTRDLAEALEVLVELGVDRVLTSGGAPDVMSGIADLAELVRQASDRIVILAGGGVREHNVRQLVLATSVDEVHASASSWTESAMTHPGPGWGFDGPVAPEKAHRTVQEATVRRLLQAMH